MRGEVRIFGSRKANGAGMLKKLITYLVFVLLCLSPLALRAAEGSLLAFVRGDNIWLASSDGSGSRPLTTSGQTGSPALSRDGKWVAFTSREGDKVGICLVPSAGGPVQRLNLPGISEAWSPAFFPDGRRLALVTRFNVRTEVVDGEKQEFATHAVSVVDRATGQIRHVVTTPDHFWDMGDIYTNLAVSPDGRLIAYQESGTDVSGGFVVVNLEGREVRRFPQDPEDYRPFWRPTFSPDGGRMLCFSMAITEGEKTYIHLVDLQTLKATRIAEGYYPTFVDGGRAIVFERWTETGRPGPDSVKIDLWRLDIAPGAKPRLILKNAEKPAGVGG
jgi:Tol biopolymer transport system component